MNPADEVWSEAYVMELLGIKRKQLDYLRFSKDFPYVKIGATRIYLAEDVVKYIKDHRRN
jgi:hypothetical protein